MAGLRQPRWKVEDADLGASKAREIDGGCSACPLPAMAVLRFRTLTVRVCANCWRQLRMAVAVAVPNS